MDRIEEGQFRLAQQLFHAGDRARALGLFRELLPAVHGSDPDSAAGIACLIAETLRGQGDLPGAAFHYERALILGRRLDADERLEGMFSHYGPRAHLGLILVLRRQLSPDHERLRDLLASAPRDYAPLGNADLTSQLSLLEGLFERQLFQLPGAQALLEEAYRGVATHSPPFLFLHPDHMQALLAQACLLRPADAIRARSMATELMQRADIGPWSRGVAAAVLLSLRFREQLAAKPPQRPAETIRRTPRAERRLMSHLARSAKFENDPFLLSEWQTQRLARIHVAGADLTKSDAVQRLAEVLADAPAPLTLLRAVELGLLAALGGPAADRRAGGFERVRERGRLALDGLQERLLAYDADESLQAQWRDWMEGGSELSGEAAATAWNSEDMMRLRAIAWP